MNKTAAIYARFSSNNQREESLDAQIRAAKEFAKNNDMKITKIYTDKAQSATTSDRPGFLEMIKDSQTELFDKVIVHKLDRFARNRYDSAVFKRKLRENEVELISVLENFDDSPESIILESVLEGMNEYYSANLAREVSKGMKENAMQCKHNGGRPPLGFDVAGDKTYKINEEDAAKVRLIFKMYAAGNGYNPIMKKLKEKGYKTQTGRNFSKPSLHDILRNEKYRGVYIFNRSASKKVGKRNHHKSKPEEEIIRIEGGMPRIVSDKTWRRVQRRMDENKKGPGAHSAKEIYLLSGLIECGKCGGSMVGNRRIAGRNRTVYMSYECSTRKRTKECDMKSINKEHVEEVVLDDMVEAMFSAANIDELAEDVYNFAKQENKEINADIKRFEKQLKNINSKIDNLTEAVAAGLFQPSMKDKLNKLEDEKADLELMLNEAKLQAEKNLPSKSKIKAELKSYRNVKNESLETQRKAVKTFVKSVIIYENNIKVNYIVDLTGGGGGSRTHVLNSSPSSFYERSSAFRLTVSTPLNRIAYCQPVKCPFFLQTSEEG